MAKWQFSYTRSDGIKGHCKVTASNKIEAIKKGMEHTAKHCGMYANVTWFDCKLIQA
jgi:hypothetical protein